MSEMGQDLNDLKTIWQSQADDKKYDGEAIFKMIHRKSINSVQWLFIITIIEFLFGLLMSLWMLFSGKHLYGIEEGDITESESFLKLENLSHLGILGSIIILGITYYFYRKISSNSSVQELISNIIQFRKSVILFIVLWLVLVIVIFMPLLIDIGMEHYLTQISNDDLDPQETIRIAKKVGYISAGITMAFILFISALYYGLIYGTFLRRLGRNLKELKEIDHA